MILHSLSEYTNSERINFVFTDDVISGGLIKIHTASFQNSRKVKFEINNSLKEKLLKHNLVRYRLKDSVVELNNMKGKKLKTMFECLVNNTYAGEIVELSLD